MIKVYCDRCGELITSSSSESHTSDMKFDCSIKKISSFELGSKQVDLCNHCKSLLSQIVYEFLEESNLIAARKRQEEKEGDVIYRQDAIDSLGEEPPVWNDEDYEIAERNQWRADVAAIEAVQSASPSNREERL